MIELVAVTHAVAVAVTAFGDIDASLGRPRRPDWPHDDTADALRPLACFPADTAEGTFLIVSDGVVVGDCGWFGPPTDGEVEIGYGLAPSARGQGWGSQAVALLLDWVATRGAFTVRAEVRLGNEPSLRLLARLGFVVQNQRAGYLALTRSVTPQ